MELPLVERRKPGVEEHCRKDEKFCFANDTKQEMSPRSPVEALTDNMRGSYEKLRSKFGSHQHIDSA